MLNQKLTAEIVWNVLQKSPYLQTHKLHKNKVQITQKNQLQIFLKLTIAQAWDNWAVICYEIQKELFHKLSRFYAADKVQISIEICN